MKVKVNYFISEVVAVVSNEEIKRMLEAKRRGVNLKKDRLTAENFRICPYCKAKNHERTLFCVKCGHKLSKTIKNKICPSCNAENLFKAKFCTNCGEKLQVTKEEKTENKISEEPPKKEIQTIHREPGEKEFNDIRKVENIEEHEDIEEHGIKTPVPDKELTNNWICPSCKSKNPKNAKFCVVCGKKFEENDLKEEGLKKEKSELGFEEKKNRPSLLDKVGKNSGEVETSDLKIHSEITVPEDIEKESGKPNNGLKSIESKQLISEDLKENDEVEGFGDVRSEDLKFEDVKSEDAKSEDVKSESETPKKEENADPIEKIKKAKELLDIGAITSEEFNAIKNKYLEKI